MQLDECINFVLTRAQNCTLTYFKNHLSEHGVTPAQYAILKCLWEQGEQSPSQLACAVHLDNSTITGILDRMASKNLLRRTPSASDRRALTISLTPLGSSLMPEIEQTIQTINHRILSVFKDGEAEHLMSCLDTIVARIETIGQEELSDID